MPVDSVETAYRESLAWLFRQTRGDAPRDPLRMTRLIEALGLEMPPRAALIVGTNGKGTVTAMAAAAASGAGLCSGRFISPHVEDFSERIAVDGLPIGRMVVVEFVERVRSTPLPLAPAFFELTLALALEHFARSQVEFAAFEAGVGARRDATAALPRIDVTAITPIARDHLETLGPDLADIARDKSAAIREATPAASAGQEPEVLDVLAAVARDKGAPLIVDAPGATLFDLPKGVGRHRDPVRRRNQRLATATVRLLGGIGEAALREGLELEPLPGRGERFRIGEVEVLLDGAHDPAAGSALAERAGGEYTLLFGSLRRKQGEETLLALEPRARRVFVTNVAGETTSLLPGAGRTLIPHPAEALSAALAAAGAGGLVVVGGSLYLAGELRPLLRQLSLEPAEPSTRVG